MSKIRKYEKATKHDEEIRKKLFSYLEEKDAFHRCEGNLEITKKFLKNECKSTEEIDHIIKLLECHSAFCDCEVLFNAYRPWA